MPSRFWTFTGREAMAVTAPYLVGWQRWLEEARARLEAARQAGAPPQVLEAAQAAVDELTSALCDEARGTVQ